MDAAMDAMLAEVPAHLRAAYEEVLGRQREQELNAAMRDTQAALVKEQAKVRPCALYTTPSTTLVGDANSRQMQTITHRGACTLLQGAPAPPTAARPY